MNRVLAVDIGGTKTSACLIEDGKVTARTVANGANLYTVGPHVVAGCVRSLLTELPPADAIVLAVAGLRTADDRQHISEAMRRAGVALPLALYSNARAALRAGGVRSGVVVVAGTGSSGLAIDSSGREWRVGGWGSLLGDEGSGAWMGRLALYAVVRAIDEGESLPGLETALLTHLHLAHPDELRGLNTASAADLGALVIPLASAWREGDPVAQEIVERAADELARLATLAAGRAGLETSGPVILVGGVFTALPALQEKIQRRLPGSDVRCLRDDPALGGYYLALEDDGWDISVIAGRTGTEAGNPATERIDKLSTIEMLRVINAEDAGVAPAVSTCLNEVARVVDATSQRMADGGRLIYVGAGSSGRLAVLDAVECVPTFGVASDEVAAIIAGGNEAMTRAIEESEDDGAAGREAIRRKNVASQDVVVGISASGRAKFVSAAVAEARRRHAFTAFLTCGGDHCPADVVISVPVGPEVISGSSRLKAGTAQKLVLNMISTGTMIRLGRTFGNHMIRVQPTNAKLRERAVLLVETLAGVDKGVALSALTQSSWDVQRAILLARLGNDEAGEAALARNGGDAKRALQETMRQN